MLYDFAKIHGAGNDFVFIEDMEDAIELSPEQIAYLCDRHFGIGADGVILVKPAAEHGCDGFMCYYNSDGTMAQMCGNGVRCFAKYLVDNGLVDKSRGCVDVWTLSGKKHIEYELGADGKLVQAKVDMGEPVTEPAEVPTTLEATTGGAVVNSRVDTPFGSFDVTCVSMGNPHCVIFMDDRAYFDDPASFDIEKIGSYMECNPIFPEKCNIEFAYVVPGSGDSGSGDSVSGDEGASAESAVSSASGADVSGTDDRGWPTILMRVWERGCGETFACGTGACATNVAAFLTGRSGRVNDLQLRGGVLHIEYAEDGRVFMTGPAKEVFRGKVELG